jgi:hypothetical protein
MKDALLKTISVYTGGILILGLVIAFMAWPVQLLWNSALVGAVDGVNEIGFIQSVGICFLTGLLFGNNTARSVNNTKTT